MESNSVNSKRNVGAKKIPVTLVTGFLGAGKTTTLNHLLCSVGSSVRIGLIENEVGAIGIDADLIAQSSSGGPEELVELENGCVCCTVRGDLGRALAKLSDKSLDVVLIETTGLADPIPVAKTILVDPLVSERFFLDGVITVADAVHLELQLDRDTGDEARRQLAFADRILLNKCDLRPAQELETLEARVRAINPSARVVRTTRGVVAAEELLGLHAFQLEAWELEGMEVQDVGGSAHSGEVTSVALRCSAPLNLHALLLWLRELLEDFGAEFYRYKGLLSVVDEESRYCLQGVHAMCYGRWCEEAPWRAEERRESRLVSWCGCVSKRVSCMGGDREVQ